MTDLDLGSSFEKTSELQGEGIGGDSRALSQNRRADEDTVFGCRKPR
jgi:hypothetical protein